MSLGTSIPSFVAAMMSSIVQQIGQLGQFIRWSMSTIVICRIIKFMALFDLVLFRFPYPKDNHLGLFMVL